MHNGRLGSPVTDDARPSSCVEGVVGSPSAAGLKSSDQTGLAKNMSVLLHDSLKIIGDGLPLRDCAAEAQLANLQEA